MHSTCYNNLMEFYQIEQFLAFAKHNNVTKAAEECNTSQPSLSRALKKLEDELEVPLFVRTKNTLTLNEYGKRAIKYAQKIVEDIASFEDALRSQYKNEASIKIVSCAPGPFWLIESVLKKNYPESSVQFELKEIPEIRADLEKENAQIAILPGKINDASFICKKISSERLYFSMPNGHKFEKKKSITFSEIDGETMLLFNEIGFWHKVHTHLMPKSHFVIQNTQNDFSALVNASSLPSFSSDVVIQHSGFVSERTDIPITDGEAFSDYYAVCRKSEYSRFRAFFDAFRDN